MLKLIFSTTGADCEVFRHGSFSGAWRLLIYSGQGYFGLPGWEGDGDLGDGNLVLTPSRSDLVVQSFRFFWPNPRREIYNLGMVSGLAL